MHRAACSATERPTQEARGLRTFITRACGLTLIFALALTAVPATAAPVDDKRAEAAEVQAQIDELDGALEIAAEDYNEAKARYDAISAQVADTEARLAGLTARQGELVGNLAARAVGMYRQGPLGALEVLLGSTTFEEFAATWDLLQDMNDNDAARIAELKQVRAQVGETQARLSVQQEEAAFELADMEARKSAVEAQLAERNRVLAGIKAEIAAILREQDEAERRRAAAAAAVARASISTAASRSEVVRIALSKLGSPYKWAAAGPDSFDCSGFTMWCYAQVGVSLPHSSRAQVSVGQRVSRADLRPGDLVFFGRPRIHHVGMYIGSGNFVHAPTTGDVVKISSLAGRSDYVGATRP